MRHLLAAMLLGFILEGDRLLSSSLSLGRIFPASRSRQRGSNIISQTITSSFFPHPGMFSKRRETKPSSVKSLSLPSFPDVIWKFNKKYLKEKNEEYIGKPSEKLAKEFEKLKKENQALLDLFSKIPGMKSPIKNNIKSDFQYDNRLESMNFIEDDPEFEDSVKPWKEELNLKEQTYENTENNHPFPLDVFENLLKESSPPKWKPDKNKQTFDINQNQKPDQGNQEQKNSVAKPTKVSSATNSPIFYIKLPAVPYEYHPSLGYISRPPTPDLGNFLRPQIDFLNNGRPTTIYQPTTMSPQLLTTRTTTSTTTRIATSTATRQTTQPSTTLRTTTQPTVPRPTMSSTIPWRSTATAWLPSSIPSSTTSTPSPRTTLSSFETYMLPSDSSPISSNVTTKTAINISNKTTKSPYTSTTNTQSINNADYDSLISLLSITAIRPPPPPSIILTSNATKESVIYSTQNTTTKLTNMGTQPSIIKSNIPPTIEPLSSISTVREQNIPKTSTSTMRPTVHGYTNSPIIWLNGTYRFNGMPSSFFIYKSKPNLKKRFDYLHKKYPKPGVYLR